MTVHRHGFNDTVVTSTSLAARQELRIPFTLSVASENTVVDVQADAAGVNTENAIISDEKSNIQITQLPLNNCATTTSL
ncbi:hypothetical protein [Edaphobacter modestus]|uniref:hypothetical protein n=1 Tax=Edaphobacter modestus TaxID=388466 RepID=UPI001F5E5097|nr:hypothetical protein [Edaphobacter modestus]